MQPFVYWTFSPEDGINNVCLMYPQQTGYSATEYPCYWQAFYTAEYAEQYAGYLAAQYRTGIIREEN